MTTRADIVAEARSWVEPITMWEHQQLMKGVACDCRGLVIGVGRALGLLRPDFNLTGYGRIPDGVTLRETCDEHMDRGELIPGNVLLLRFEKEPQHLSFLGEFEGGLTMIHAYSRAGRVVEHRLADVWKKRIVKVYSLRGLA